MGFFLGGGADQETLAVQMSISGPKARSSDAFTTYNTHLGQV